jgi:RNA polymerase sigma factor (TIGR02999 family)
MAKTDVSALDAIIQDIQKGDGAATEKLFALMYEDLHRLAQRYLGRERRGHTFQPTALIHEAYLKLIGQSGIDWKGKTHFFAVGAQAMRRILIDHERGRRRAKRGGKRLRIELDENVALSPQRDEDIVALDEALSKLAKSDPRQATIVELRFFGGMSVAEVAEVLGISKRTVESEWTMVRAWLRRELTH